MSYFLDTNVCIAAMNGRPPGIADRIAGTIASGYVVAISTIVVFELQYGISKSVQVDRNTRALHTFLRPLLIFPFDEEDAAHAAQTRAMLESKGNPIGPYDYLIAAQALRHKFIIVTANTGEFSRIKELECENWVG